MTRNDQTGPWLLALGTLAVGVAAVGAELLRRRGREDRASEQGDERRGPRERDDDDDEWAADRGLERQ